MHASPAKVNIAGAEFDGDNADAEFCFYDNRSLKGSKTRLAIFLDI